MGVVRRQGIKQSIVTYSGIMVGGLSSFFVYPLEKEAYGLVQFVLSTAVLAVPFTLLGTPNVAIRFFPEFKHDRGHHGLFPTLLLAFGVGFFLLALLSFLLQDVIEGALPAQSDFLGYWQYALPLVFFMALSKLLAMYTANFQRIAVPEIFVSLLPKVGLPVLILLVYFDYFTWDQLLLGVLSLYALGSVFLLVYLHGLGELRLQFDPKFWTRERSRRVINFGLYGVLGGWSSIIAQRLDIFMVGVMTGQAGKVSVYVIAAFMADVIDVPRRAILNISGPLISRAWTENDQAYLRQIYRQSSLVQFIFGWLIFGGTWLCLDALFDIMTRGDDFRAGKYVVLLLGIAKVTDMITGVNTAIIGNSPYYRFNLVAVILLAVLNIVNNYLFIPILDIEGAALATLLSVTLFNLMKGLFIWFKLRMHPFQRATGYVLLLGLASYGITALLPTSSIPLLEILMRGGMFTGLFMGSILYFEVSPEVSDIWSKWTQKVRNR